MRKSKIGIGFMIALTVLALAACNAQKNNSGESAQASGTASAQPSANVKRGELKVAYNAQPGSLDPHMSFLAATTDIMWHVYETLLVVDQNGKIQPMLAESYEESEDGKTITFPLRKGVKFHNGKEMDADDVAASMNRWIKLSVNGNQFFKGATFEAKDKYTAVLHMPERLSIAVITLASPTSGLPAIMPKEVAESAPDKGLTQFIGTGPFKFDEWKQDQYIALSRFDGYQSRQEPASGMAGKKEALLEKITFEFTPDPQTLLSGLQSGAYDVGQNVLYDNAKQIESDPNVQIFAYPAAQLPIVFNKKHGVFANVKARQAVAAALDMDAILKGAFTDEAYYKKNGTMMNGNQTLWKTEVGLENYNVKNAEKAKQLLSEAGYHGEAVTIIVDRAYQEHYNAAVILQEQLKKIGMNVNMQVFDFATVIDRTYQENAYDIYMYGFLPEPTPLQLAYLDSTYPGWTTSPELEAIKQKMKSAPSLDDAIGMYDELQKWFWDYQPIVKVGDYDALVGVRKSVKGYAEQNKGSRPMYWNVSNEK